MREHENDERLERTIRIMRDRGTRLERAVGWLLAYPVRFMVIMLALVLMLTIGCGL